MSLTKLGYYMRIIINVGIGILVIYILALILSPTARNAFKAIFPEKDPPLPSYGKLPPLEFVAYPIQGSTPEYELNTVNAKLPGRMPSKLPVYKFLPPQFSYEAGKRAQTMATKLGYFESDLVTDLKGSEYVWRDITFGGRLAVNLTDISVVHRVPYKNLGLYYERGRLNETSAEAKARSMVNSLDLMESASYKESQVKVILGKYINQNREIVKADFAGEAQLARIDFYRFIDDYPILGPDPQKGMIHVIVGTPNIKAVNLDYPTLEAYIWNVDGNARATYPLLPLSAAWNEVKQNKGVISNVTSTIQSPFENYTQLSISKILIDNIFIAYYDSPKKQEYLQPVYVFDGKFVGTNNTRGDITIYYPAVDGVYIESAENDVSSEFLQPSQE